MVATEREHAQNTSESLEQRFLSFVLEQHPFATAAAKAAYASATKDKKKAKDLEQLGPKVADALRGMLKLEASVLGDGGLPETTPFVSPATRFSYEVERLALAVEGFFAREAIAASFTHDDKRWMLEGIILTRAVDNRMKQMFLSGELKYGPLGFQGKGFRSLGQEAVYAGALRMKRGDAYRSDGGWTGDVVAPLIRDLGMMLAFTDDPTCALNAQAGKSGAPLNGKDLHLGDLDLGVLPAAAPLSIATCTVTGMGLGMQLKGEQRVGVSFIGDGGSSLGEWHESINIAAARKLPMVFCVQNNQTALSTRVEEQSRVRVFAEKALGYGMPYLTLDGTDPEAIAAGFCWAADFAREGNGPVLIELVAMRMCGHAHHDDMLYLGGDPDLGFDLPKDPGNGYANADKYAQWAGRDPLASYAKKLIAEGVVTADDVEKMKVNATDRCNRAMDDIKSREWPESKGAGVGVYSDGPTLAHGEPTAVPTLPEGDVVIEVEAAPAFDRKGNTYLDAVCQGVGDVLAAHDNAFLYGEDIGPPYGNAFLLLRPLLEKYGERIINAPIAEGGIIGALVGAALEGMLPIGEMQFNDFVASGFNELVNNAAKFRYRIGRNLPLVLRMPWGGLRRAGPYHSQDTSPWFYRSFGLKIVAPSTPHDARALMMAAAKDPDPVLYYEHIGLYRAPHIKQVLDEAPAEIPLGKAAFRRLGDDLTIISYGAFVHRAWAAANAVEESDGVSCDVLDLRSLTPIDWPRIVASVKKTGRVLLVGEDSKTGSILESIGSKISESLFEHLDGPVRVLGALDAPVPYAPSLEDAYLVSEDMIADTARALMNW